MLRLLTMTDRAADGIARTATTLGQCGLVALGVHLAADSLDDRIYLLLSRGAEWIDGRLLAGPGRVGAGSGMSAVGLPGLESLPLPAMAAWAALGVELTTTLLLWGAFLLTPRAATPDWRGFRRALCVRAVVLPATLAGVLIAGSWSLAMGLEDLLPPSAVAPWATRLVGAAGLLRFGWPAWRRAVSALQAARGLADGWGTALALAPIGVMAWMVGVPGLGVWP